VMAKTAFWTRDVSSLSLYRHSSPALAHKEQARALACRKSDRSIAAGASRLLGSSCAGAWAQDQGDGCL